MTDLAAVMVTGTAGSGKTSLASHFANQVCTGGRRCLFIAFEEAAAQTIRNMRSIGIDLEKQINKSSADVHHDEEQTALLGGQQLDAAAFEPECPIAVELDAEGVRCASDTVDDDAGGCWQLAQSRISSPSTCATPVCVSIAYW